MKNIILKLVYFEYKNILCKNVLNIISKSMNDYTRYHYFLPIPQESNIILINAFIF